MQSVEKRGLWLRQVQLILCSGHSLDQAISFVAAQEVGGLKVVLETIASGIDSSGSNVSDIPESKQLFNPYLCELISSGQATEKIALACGLMADTEQAIDQRIAAYRQRLGVVRRLLRVIFSALFLISVVMPPLFDSLSKLGGVPPLPTQLLANLSQYIRMFAPILVLISVVYYFWWKREDHIRLKYEVLALALRSVTSIQGYEPHILRSAIGVIPQVRSLYKFRKYLLSFDTTLLLSDAIERLPRVPLSLHTGILLGIDSDRFADGIDSFLKFSNLQFKQQFRRFEMIRSMVISCCVLLFMLYSLAIYLPVLKHLFDK